MKLIDRVKERHSTLVFSWREAIAEAELIEQEALAFRWLVSKNATTLWDGDYRLKITLENVKAAMKETKCPQSL